MIQALLHARKKMFGASTETAQVDGRNIADEVSGVVKGSVDTP